MLVGIGTDIVEIARIETVIDKHGLDFIKRILTDSEYKIAEGKNFAVEHLAGRWACKESVAKALGCGIGENCNWHDIEIFYGKQGGPEVELKGVACETARRKDIVRLKISISHEKHYATAMAVAVSC